MTHYPPLVGHDRDMANILRTIMKDPGLPERYRDPAGWPEPMRREDGADGGAGPPGGRRRPLRRESGAAGGTASAAAHRESLLRHFRHQRKLLDDFRPEVVVIWGDDQHEEFHADLIPPFFGPASLRTA